MRFCSKKYIIIYITVYSLVVYILYFKFIKGNAPGFCRSFSSKDSVSWSLKTQHDVSRAKIEKIFYNVSKSFNVLNKTSSHHKRWVQLSEDMYAYSAYITECDSVEVVLTPLCVKFIGVTLVNLTDVTISNSPIKCAFRNYNHTVSKIGFAALEKLHEAHEAPYTAALFYCSLYDKDRNSWPEYASLYEDDNRQISWIRVQASDRHFPMGNEEVHVNVCVRPIYGRIPVASLTEFISYYSVMGVDHYTFYYLNKTESLFQFMNVARIFNVSIDVLPWNVPLPSEKLHSFGQLAFVQDCLSLSAHVFSHTAIVDFDEYIVPKKHDNLKAFLYSLDKAHKDAGSYVIPNIFFCKEYPVDEFSALDIFFYKRRQATVWQYWYRSKYIVKADRVLQGGIHFVWKHDKNSKEVRVSHTEALLHHYRLCCGLMQTWLLHLLSFNVLDDAVVVDDSLATLQNKIYNHILVRTIFNASLITSQ